jgi:hypothetical protein
MQAMNDAPSVFFDSPLCRFLANLQKAIDEVAACEGGRANILDINLTATTRVAVEGRVYTPQH